ncbi:MAG: phosphoribosyltransferase [Chloroflexi bacterium]|nr:phosphoribosyltransferase [Chloroflexota bacterium]
MYTTSGRDDSTLWLARVLFDLGAISFGDFSLGRTAVHSPVYVNPRRLLSEPALLQRVAALLDAEIKAGQARRRPRLSPFSLVAGVPFGGLHLALAYSLYSGVPMCYARPAGTAGKDHVIEGYHEPGQTALIIDDLMTGGGSILQNAHILEEFGIQVRDAVVLIDREQGGIENLRQHGYNVISILRLKTMLTYYYELGLITPTWYERSMAYLEKGPAPT